jgi:hypothetical protein
MNVVVKQTQSAFENLELKSNEKEKTSKKRKREEISNDLEDLTLLDLIRKVKDKVSTEGKLKCKKELL